MTSRDPDEDRVAHARRIRRWKADRRITADLEQRGWLCLDNQEHHALVGFIRHLAELKSEASGGEVCECHYWIELGVEFGCEAKHHASVGQDIARMPRLARSTMPAPFRMTPRHPRAWK